MAKEPPIHTTFDPEIEAILAESPEERRANIRAEAIAEGSDPDQAEADFDAAVARLQAHAIGISVGGDKYLSWWRKKPSGKG